MLSALMVQLIEVYQHTPCGIAERGSVELAGLGRLVHKSVLFLSHLKNLFIIPQIDQIGIWMRYAQLYAR